MKRIGPRSIRGKVTVMAGVATAIAMALVVCTMAFGMRLVLEQAIADSLHDRLDQARSLVEAGDYAAAADAAGNEVIQVIDERGEVVAGSRNARGLAAIVGPESEGRTELDELQFAREEPDASGSKAEGERMVPEAPATSTEAGSERGNAASTGASGDSTDGDDAYGDGDDRVGRNDDDRDDADDDDDDDAESDDDADDDADDEDDDDADDDDDDFDFGHANRFAKRVASQSSRPAPQSSRPPRRILFGPMRQAAWADEPPAEADSVDAQSILGVEGPYLILKEQATSPDGPMTIAAVTSLASAVDSARRMAWMLAALMLAVLVAVVAFAWMLTGRTLKPVEEMRAQAASITADDLGQRIDAPSADKDLARLAETLNAMLARVERSLDEEKRFISDASHELKSPIAASAIILDTLRAYPDELDATEAIDDLAGENARMASIVGDMLALTRYDEGRLRCDPEPVDLMDLVLEEVMAVGVRCTCEIDATDVSPVVCRVDARLIGHALRNLLDNAARYAERVVKVSCREEAGSIAIVVSDDGCGIDPDDRERAFGRFVCLDERSGTGLGLAVVASAVAAHGGTVRFVDPELDGATARIDLPR